MEQLVDLKERWASIHWRRLYTKGDVIVYVGLQSWSDFDKSGKSYNFIEEGDFMYESPFHIALYYGSNRYWNVYIIDEKVNFRKNIKSFVHSFIQTVESGKKIDEPFLKELMQKNELLSNREVERLAFNAIQNSEYDLIELENNVNNIFDKIQDKIPEWKQKPRTGTAQRQATE